MADPSMRPDPNLAEKLAKGEDPLADRLGTGLRERLRASEAVDVAGGTVPAEAGQVAPASTAPAPATATEPAHHDAPVIAPDQLKPGHPKAFKIAGWLTAGALLLMMTPPGNWGNIARIYLAGFAVLIALLILADPIMRRRGLKR